MNWARKLSVVLSSPSFMTKRQIAKKKALYILAVCFLFAACTTVTTRKYGSDFDKTKVQLIVKGKSTKQNIAQLMGEPYDKTLDVAGAEKWIYLYTVTTIIQKEDALGGFTTEGTIEEKKLEIVFDQDIVKNFVLSESTTPYSRTAPKFQR